MARASAEEATGANRNQGCCLHPTSIAKGYSRINAAGLHLRYFCCQNVPVLQTGKL